MKKKLLFCLLLCTVVFNNQLSHAQVTIGTKDKPIEGAILQLTEGTTTTKGLGMPRVWLRDSFDIRTDISGVETGQENAHTALVTYNVNPCFGMTGIGNGDGLYVWSGNQWDYLGDKPKKSSEVKTYTDQEGKSFRAREFGSAGIWMIENLSVKKYAPGQGGGSVGIFSGGSDYENPRWCYPGTKLSGASKPAGAMNPSDPAYEGGKDPFFYNEQPEIGYLYNYTAATNRPNISTLGLKNENQESPTTEQPVGVQGVCPDDWHIPSDREWNVLEKEIALFPEKYSSNTGTVWNAIWEIAMSPVYRPANGSANGHGFSMMSKCFPMFAQTAGESSVGKSMTIDQGGFNVILAGFVAATGMYNYGKTSYFWTSSFTNMTSFPGEGAGARGRNFNELAPASVIRSDYRLDRMFNIRCKKNN